MAVSLNGINPGGALEYLGAYSERGENVLQWELLAQQPKAIFVCKMDQWDNPSNLGGNLRRTLVFESKTEGAVFNGFVLSEYQDGSIQMMVLVNEDNKESSGLMRSYFESYGRLNDGGVNYDGISYDAGSYKGFVVLWDSLNQFGTIPESHRSKIQNVINLRL